MKRLKDKLKTILTGKKGESLVEGLVSLLVFSVLMMAVTMMINTSLRMTAASTADASAKQESFNNAVFEQYTTPAAVNLLLQTSGSAIDVSVPVYLSNDGTYVSFSPR